MKLNEIIKSDERFRYQLLSRMQSDCKYYLGYGGRSQKVLWAENEETHIKIMKSIWNSFTDEEKPEWLSWDDILEYETKMKS